jgi:hypothetical protein
MPRRIITAATVIDADAYQDGLTKRRDTVHLTIDLRSAVEGMPQSDRATVEIVIPRHAVINLAEKAAKNRTRRATVGGMRARVIASSY